MRSLSTARFLNFIVLRLSQTKSVSLPLRPNHISVSWCGHLLGAVPALFPIRLPAPGLWRSRHTWLSKSQLTILCRVPFSPWIGHIQLTVCHPSLMPGELYHLYFVKEGSWKSRRLSPLFKVTSPTTFRKASHFLTKVTPLDRPWLQLSDFK